MRIAVAGLHTESSTANPVPTRTADFRQLRGAALLADPYFAFLGDYPATFLPLLHARALPGGPVAPEAYQAFRSEILNGLAQLGPLGGVYLAMHGAMFVDGMEDAEGDFIAAVRATVGPDCLIAASYDHHGNLSQRIIDALDIFASYRTAPHIDVEDTMRRAVSMLTHALTTGERPGIVWAPVPALFSGEMTSTEDEPAGSFFASLPAHETACVWDVSFQIGYVWADEPRATAAAVITGTHAPAMAETARAVARSYWGLRDMFRYCMPSACLPEALDQALSAATRPVILADSGDNPTGGGVGDRADVLAAALARGTAGKRVLFAGIADAPATEAALRAGAGGVLTVGIGGSHGGGGPRANLTARVLRVEPGAGPADARAVLAVGDVTLITTARRRPFHHLTDFTGLSLTPEGFDLIVVKSGYLSPELAPRAAPALMALTEGAVPQDLTKVTNLRRHRPTVPFDAFSEWAPQVVTSARFA